MVWTRVQHSPSPTVVSREDSAQVAMLEPYSWWHLRRASGDRGGGGGKCFCCVVAVRRGEEAVHEMRTFVVEKSKIQRMEQTRIFLVEVKSSSQLYAYVDVEGPFKRMEGTGKAGGSLVNQSDARSRSKSWAIL